MFTSLTWGWSVDFSWPHNYTVYLSQDSAHIKEYAVACTNPTFLPQLSYDFVKVLIRHGFSGLKLSTISLWKMHILNNLLNDKHVKGGNFLDNKVQKFISKTENHLSNSLQKSQKLLWHACSLVYSWSSLQPSQLCCYSQYSTPAQNIFPNTFLTIIFSPN